MAYGVRLASLAMQSNVSSTIGLVSGFHSLGDGETQAAPERGDLSKCIMVAWLSRWASEPKVELS